MQTNRREFLQAVGLLMAGTGVLGAPAVIQAQTRQGVPTAPVKIGILTLRAGVAAPVGTAGLRGAEWWTERANQGGGILGRWVELIVEGESSPKDTVERFRKLALQTKVDVISGGISTAVGLALGPVAEELQMLWLSWDATTEKGVEETMPNPTYSFRSVDNEAEAIGGALLTAKYFPDVKTIAGINNDYSYGRDCWDAYLPALKRRLPDVKPVLDLWPKLGVTDFTSHIAAIQQAKPDLLMTSFWSGDTAIFLK